MASQNFQPLYNLRLFLTNGQILNYHFTNAAHAVNAKDTCAAAMLAAREAPKQPRTAANPGAEAWVPPAICKFVDDAHREAHWDGAAICGVQLGDMFEDIEMQVRLEIMAKRETQALLTMAGETPQPSPQNQPPYRDDAPAFDDRAPRQGAIGSFAA